MSVIRTEYATKDERGYINYHSQQSYRSVERQVNAVLETVKNADGLSAREAYEWVSSYTETGDWVENLDTPFPKGDVFVCPHRGNSEGWIIDILVRLPNGEDKALRFCQAICIKFLCDPDLVYAAARALSEAFEAGCYGYELPPTLFYGKGAA